MIIDFLESIVFFIFSFIFLGTFERFYEPDPKDDLSSSNIILLERNLKQALQQVQNKKVSFFFSFKLFFFISSVAIYKFLYFFLQNELIKSPSRKYKKRNQVYSIYIILINQIYRKMIWREKKEKAFQYFVFVVVT